MLAVWGRQPPLGVTSALPVNNKGAGLIRAIFFCEMSVSVSCARHVMLSSSLVQDDFEESLVKHARSITELARKLIQFRDGTAEPCIGLYPSLQPAVAVAAIHSLRRHNRHPTVAVIVIADCDASTLALVG